MGSHGQQPNISISDHFGEVTQANPQRTAVDSDGRSVTYGELASAADDLSLRIAGFYTGETRPQNRIVGVSIGRGEKHLASLLAIAKLGLTYLPITTDTPPDRLRWILEDSDPGLIICTGDEARSIRDLRIGLDDRLLIADQRVDQDERIQVRHDRKEFAADSRRFKYLLYTSGSTGKPKGVVSGHDGLLNRLVWMQNQFTLGPFDKVLQKTPLTFDVSLWECLWPLMFGAAVVVAKPRGHLDPGYLAEVIRKKQVTVLHFVPSIFDTFWRAGASTPSDNTSVRLVITSGEQLLGQHARRAIEAFPKADLFNLYGPTEASIDVTFHQVVQSDLEGPVPIGRPIENMRVYVVDGQGRPVATGNSGELWLAGVGLADGYHKSVDKTLNVFLDDPEHIPEKRIYRTGDIVLQNRNGNLIYVDRIDRQIKFRGVRIELPEIEQALSSYPAVVDAQVLYLRVDSDTRLVAVVQVTQPLGEDATVYRQTGIASELRDHLYALLPANMIPTDFFFLNQWPTNDHGKRDHSHLEEMTRNALHSTAAARAAEPESNHDISGTILEIFRRTLGSEDILSTDSFFDVGGGTSLDAVQLASKVEKYINETFNVDVSSDALIYIYPTAEELAHEIEALIHGH